jgi:hypothetical protein
MHRVMFETRRESVSVLNRPRAMRRLGELKEVLA